MKLSQFRWTAGKMRTCCRPFIVLLLAVFLLTVTACNKKGEDRPVLQHQGWVSDYAGLLTPADKTRIAATLAAYEKETCHQIFLLIIPSLNGEKMAQFSQRTATAWDIGQPGFGNGFLLTMAMQEGKVRIESGTYFEWLMKDGTAAKILREDIIPFFKQKKFVEGVENGLQGIMAAGRMKPIPLDQKPDICRQ